MFKPKFCPNIECSNHVYPGSTRRNWFSKDGFYHTKAFGKVQRFRCKHCKQRFSEQTFSLNYHVKKKICYRSILDGLISSSSISDISRKEGVSRHTIINRERRMAIQAIAVHSKLLSNISLQEPIVCDGFQSLVTNFYFPNNINIAIGKSSQFFYCMNYAQIKRAGKLTWKQKIKKKQNEEKHYIDPHEIETSFSLLIDSIVNIPVIHASSTFSLYTDKKKEYGLAIRKNRILQLYKDSNRFEHIQISSKEPRTVNNPLFAVNYMDRQFRKDLAEHTVKSICFGRNVNNQMERLAIYRFYHNCLKKFRVRGNTYLTHSEVAGISENTRKESIRMFFHERLFISQVRPIETDLKILGRNYSTPLINDREDNVKKTKRIA